MHRKLVRNWNANVIIGAMVYVDEHLMRFLVLFLFCVFAPSQCTWCAVACLVGFVNFLIFCICAMSIQIIHHFFLFIDSDDVFASVNF